MVKFDQCGLLCHYLYIVSPVVHTLLPSVLQRLDSRGIEALILSKMSLTADMASSAVRYGFPAKCFFMLGTRT